MRSLEIKSKAEHLAAVHSGELRLGRPAIQVVITAPSGHLAPASVHAAWSWLSTRYGMIGDVAMGITSPIRKVVLEDGRDAATLVLDPAVIDAESIPIILNDFAGYLRGQSGVMPPKDISSLIADMPGRDRGAAEAFFEALLENTPPVELSLEATEFSAGTMCRAEMMLDERSTEDLRAVLQSCGATMEQAILAGWSIVEARWSGRPDLCLGLRVSMRGLHSRAEEAVGCLAATLPCPIHVGPDRKLSEFLSDLRQVSDSIAAHAQGAIGLSGSDDSGAATFMQESWRTAVHVHAQDLETRLQVGGRWPKGWTAAVLSEALSPVALVATDGPRLRFALEFDSVRLPEATAERMLAHLNHLLLEFGSGSAERPIADIEMIGQEEQAALLALGEPERPGPPSVPCPVTRFEAAVAQWRDDTALDNPSGAGRITYGALDRQANGLAHRLADAGVASGDVVALCLPRGAEIVVAMLAVLKLGAVFLPIDPEQSEGWRRDMMMKTGARHMIVVKGSEAANDHAVLIEFAAREADHPPSRPLPAVDRGAYILFTSGSSGKPKAVLGLTGALSAHADAMISTFALSPADRVLQFAGQTFDVFLEEVFPTLLSGGRVVFRDEHSASSARGFLDFVQRHRVTLLNLPASFWHVLMQELSEHELALPASVRLLVAGSERVLPADLRKWQELAPGVGFINAYGPTETTITATAWLLPEAAPMQDPSADVPIGRPLPHARAILRAHDGTLTPRGGTGVLWIGGAAVTGGYLGDPERTDDVFRADPWHVGQRLYRTGDMARWRDDDQLAFLGRADRQVKIRGHRIDLHQVEAAILAVPGLRQVHVEAEQSGAGVRLLGWIVCDPALALEDVKAAASQHLPDYMVPHLISMQDLPRKAGGKIDTKALPRPVRTRSSNGAADELASELAVCMAEILGLASVGIDDNFHDIGGDSLSALRLVGLVEQRLSFSLQQTDLMGHPTARGLAEVIRTERIHAGCTVTIQAQGTRPPLFAVHVLGRNGSFFRPLAEALGPDFPVYGLSAGIPRLEEDVEVERIARWYFEEIQRHCPEGPVAVMGFSLASHYAFEVARLLRAVGREVSLLGLIDIDGPGGRPSLRGMAKLSAHLRQFGRYGPSYVKWLFETLWEKRPRLRFLARASDEAMFDIVAANQRAVDVFKAKPYDGKITVYRAEWSFTDSEEAIRSALGWAPVALGGAELIDVPGNHMTMLEVGNVDAMARHVAHVLSRGEKTGH